MTVTETQLKTRSKALRQARIQFRESMADPLQRAMISRSPMATASIVWDIPIEAAANGFVITIGQGPSLWTVEIEREIDDDCSIHRAGQAKSLIKALWQLVNATEIRIAELMAKCSAELKRKQEAAEVAA